PGLAKTLTIKTLADVLHASFRRIQFTPDLVPGDLVGTRIYRPDRGTFDTELGPVFCNFLLADEINRAPAKVQSALLEVMQERQALPTEVYVDRPIVDYAVALTAATRYPERVGLPNVKPYIAFGASPRGSINLVHAARALALVRGRRYVVPGDVVDLSRDVLRH